MKQNKHIRHIEELIIDNGIKTGTSDALNILNRSREYLVDDVTIKIDGAPAIIAGYDPDGRFFVATKSFFNKTPKLNYTSEDIIRNHSSEELRRKLVLCMNILPKVIQAGVFQGDLLYTHEKDEVVMKPDSVSFTPNTVTYTVNRTVEVTAILKSKLGIAFHTQYEHTADGYRITDFDLDELKHSSDVWMPSVRINDKYGLIEQRGSEEVIEDAISDHIYSHLDNLGLEADFYYVLDEDIRALLKMYINHKIKLNVGYYNREAELVCFVQFVENREIAETKKLKMDRNKIRKMKEFVELKSRILMHPDTRFVIMETMALTDEITKFKEMIIDRLDRVPYVLNPSINGNDCGQEGYVIDGFKLVDRGTFSRANFENTKFRG